jgi:hypothetical protein
MPPIDLVKAAVIIDPVKPALSDPVVATTDPVVKVGPAIWIARLRTGREVIFPTSVSKISNAAALVVEISVVVIVLETVVVVIVLAVEDLAAAGIASAVAALAAGEDSVDSVAAGDSEDAVAGSGADDNKLGLGFASNFSYNQNSTNPLKTNI